MWKIYYWFIEEVENKALAWFFVSLMELTQLAFCSKSTMAAPEQYV